MSQPIYSTGNLPLAGPVFIVAGSPEEYLLDPRYHRIVDSLPSGSSLRKAIPSTSTPQNQFSQSSKITTSDKFSGTPSQGAFAIQLDDITIYSGPTSYMDGSRKRYEVTFKVNNSQRLLIKDVDYKIAEVQ